jgi:hypothetical protein
VASEAMTKKQVALEKKKSDLSGWNGVEEKRGAWE